MTMRSIISQRLDLTSKTRAVNPESSRCILNSLHMIQRVADVSNARLLSELLPVDARLLSEPLPEDARLLSELSPEDARLLLELPPEDRCFFGRGQATSPPKGCR